MKSYNKFIKLLMILTIAVGVNISINDTAYSAATAVKTAPEAVKTAPASTIYTSVNPIDVVNNPSKYLNKNIKFDAEFETYTSLGLDYKPAYKDPAKYIGILIRRNDVKQKNIPLSEMKIFLDRETAEKHPDLDSGDKIRISGKVFSTALGDPWVDVKKFEVLTVKPKDTK